MATTTYMRNNEIEFGNVLYGPEHLSELLIALVKRGTTVAISAFGDGSGYKCKLMWSWNLSNWHPTSWHGLQH